MLVGSCYSCCLVVKCGGAEVVWELLIPLLCLNQGPFCGVSALTASFLRVNDLRARKRFIVQLSGEFLKTRFAARTNVVTTEP